LVKDIAASGLIDTVVMKTSLELNLLAAAGLIRDESAHQKRLIRINTGLVFKQQKYNILREETEGYAKLNVMLCFEMPFCDSNKYQEVNGEDHSVNKFIANVLSVVGFFELEVRSGILLL
jgi:THO complex subunit 2